MQRSLRILFGLLLTGILSSSFAFAVVDDPATATLDRSLLKEKASVLAREAIEKGDAKRGAFVFYRPELNCAKCHILGGHKQESLGPNLAISSKNVSNEYLVESVLEPSKVLKKGFEPIAIATIDGKTISGLFVEENSEEVLLTDLEHAGKPFSIKKKDIDQRRIGGISVMPPGLINSLGGRQDFLDLICFLREVADKGPDRAIALKPAWADAVLVMPEYEKHVDHAGMIAALGPKNYEKGKAIYQRVCANCHGTKDRAGSLPTSLKFASDAFKNGSDPYSMYRTITYGYGMMTPQTWMVPEQKYDVIHYIREAYLKPFNKTRYVRADAYFLGKLPKGNTRGPKPSEIESWVSMNYGPNLDATIEIPGAKPNIAYKGIAVRVDPGPGGISRGHDWILYEHDTLRAAGGWNGSKFIDWQGINFNGSHQVHPRVVGEVAFSVSNGLGWADPKTGSFEDPRPPARDGRRYGPLPKALAQYKGLFHFGDRIVLSYEVGGASILESPGLREDARDGEPAIFKRTLNIGRSSHDVKTRLAGEPTAAAIAGGNDRIKILREDQYKVLTIPASSTPISLTILVGGRDQARVDRLAKEKETVEDLAAFTRGGPSRWPEEIKTKSTVSFDDGGPFAVDDLALPDENPWSALIRPTGFDFAADGKSAAVCTWDGDVWRVSGFDKPNGDLSWRRIESGLFQPLGLKIVGGSIYVSCRDEIVKLVDLNGDGEVDFDECFNSDHQVTEHFHEFAMDLQIDAEGRFYYAKAARHGLPAIVPQHGTLLRVSKDGDRTDILATGFRAPNGVLVNGDGTFFMTDQEGFWLPKNRINWVRRGKFYGNLWGYTEVTDPSDTAMEQPVCWITNDFDRSPGEMIRVEGKAWKPLQGSLLNLSYGHGKIYVVPIEQVGDRMQGGMCALPLPTFPTGVMRGRFHPIDGQLYACGMFAWAGNQTRAGGFYRVRATGKPIVLPVALHAKKQGMEIMYSSPILREGFQEHAEFGVKVWSLKRSADYGSKHLNEHELKVTGANLLEDGRTVFVSIPKLAPTMGMEIKYSLKSSDGRTIEGTIHNSIQTTTD